MKEQKKSAARRDDTGTGPFIKTVLILVAVAIVIVAAYSILSSTGTLKRMSRTNWIHAVISALLCSRTVPVRELYLLPQLRHRNLCSPLSSCPSRHAPFARQDGQAGCGR